MNHPNSVDLEAFACGDVLPHVAAHVDSCAECMTFVARARAFVADAPGRDVPQLPAEKAPSSTVVPFPVRRAVFLALPFVAVAAMVLLFLRGPDAEVTPSVAAAPSSTAARGDAATSGSVDPGPPARIAFKGGIQVAVVRDRGGVQERLTGNVGVTPGDQIRVEIALDSPRTLMAVVVTDDGATVPVMAESLREPGTHFSDSALRIDAVPMGGTLVVGTRADIEAARRAKSWTGVVAVPIRWEGRP